ncbi:hypothetical protein Vretimale_11742 [Volvox reticuliferus]|uniref:Uncharacterized protein n=1 Tax=Volvox reticuliferus TaxID=1737510 RepID=A0A8J4LRV4_9CHLO|nr:hypothetical protein Vretimale_11742 [Volvox reticuliferus]
MPFQKACRAGLQQPSLPIRVRNEFPARRQPNQPKRSCHDNAAALKCTCPVSMPASAGRDVTTAAAGRVTRPGASDPSPTPLSGAPLLADLQNRARSPSTVNVFGKPFTKTELTALDAAVSHLSNDAHGSAAAASGLTALRRHLLEDLLLEASVFKRIPLPVVEGAMALLELMSHKPLQIEPFAGGPDTGRENPFVDDPALLSQYRWQLVVGADVGGVQYIPAVEELEVGRW